MDATGEHEQDGAAAPESGPASRMASQMRSHVPPGSGQEGAPLKDWLIRRNCSASPRQFVWFYVSLAFVSSMIALSMWLRGAWMIVPFTGLELLAVGVAFVIYARHAVDYEYIGLHPHCLVVECMSAEQLTHLEFNPRWVRVEPGATPRDRITLHSGGRSVAIGQYLAQHRRAQFARELRTWLRACS
jgi:uncharacterized membrane protein